MPLTPGAHAPTPPFNGTEACNGVAGVDFFDGSPEAQFRARALCAKCPMQQICDDWALNHEEFGMWAGRTARQRKRRRLELGITLHRPEACGTRRPSAAAAQLLVA